MKRKITTIFLLGYFWVMVILLGSIVLETVMFYPNIFHDVPNSLKTSMEFMAVASPSTFFPPLGFICWVTGIGSVIFAWQVKSARYWVASSLLMILLEGIVTMLFFWPRNEIMFIEGIAVHSAAVLQQAAQEFQSLHWFRVGFNVAGSILIFIGITKYHRYLITTEHAKQEKTKIDETGGENVAE